MKMRQPHIVPLASQSQALLRELQALTGRVRFVFPSARGQVHPLNEKGVRAVLSAMGYDNTMMTPYGFRDMARTVLDEVIGYRIDCIEYRLAHTWTSNRARRQSDDSEKVCHEAYLAGFKHVVNNEEMFRQSLRSFIDPKIIAAP
jgi:integrase